ncbi:hypothetical protein GCM10020220_114170 [Nonomuraea rubra]
MPARSQMRPAPRPPAGRPGEQQEGTQAGRDAGQGRAGQHGRTGGAQPLAAVAVTQAGGADVAVVVVRLDQPGQHELAEHLVYGRRRAAWPR